MITISTFMHTYTNSSMNCSFNGDTSVIWKCRGWMSFFKSTLLAVHYIYTVLESTSAAGPARRGTVRGPVESRHCAGLRAGVSTGRRGATILHQPVYAAEHSLCRVGRVRRVEVFFGLRGFVHSAHNLSGTRSPVLIRRRDHGDEILSALALGG